ncbi:universal stress protein [Candidatus Nitrosotalea okcheonensis]|uniref:UspA domain-containing protein n=1 Tax=Candidatus Nitrosotalea okcheonensis TaxID=1903276 RepID=A0A2H1FEK7_9ARCH|nr:universal stress protein [Candidatus Nitrosotalea okcheonensis]SMH71193.1 UspA domain-containing protein [Candidatus Nitrosotalea okcheonensis]
MRKKISRILVPLDGSKNSLKGLDFAIYLARQCGATITGLYVLSFYIADSGPRIFGPYKKDLLQNAKNFIYDAKVRSAKEGVDLKEKIIEGDVVFQDIVKYANSGKCDIMVMSSRGFGPAKGWFLGSVTYSALHKSKIPVLVVK